MFGENFPPIIQSLIEAGADVHKIDSRHGTTTLQKGFERGATTEIIQILLEAGADPYSKAPNGLDCFELALISGAEENMSCLLEYAKSHTHLSHWLQVPRDGIATELNDPTARFLESLHHASMIDKRDELQHTLLFHAASKGNRKLVERLLMYGANAIAADPCGWTPLHAAVWQLDAEISQLLLEAGAGVVVTQTLHSDNKYSDFRSPSLGDDTTQVLHLAVKPPSHSSEYVLSTDLVRMLLDHRANPNEEMHLAYLDSEPPAMRTSLALILNGISCISVIHPSVFDTIQCLIDRGAIVGRTLDNMSIKDVAKFEGHETLWEGLQEGTVTNSLSLKEEEEAAAVPYNTPSRIARLGKP